jgi:hypothetical protein
MSKMTIAVQYDDTYMFYRVKNEKTLILQFKGNQFEMFKVSSTKPNKKFFEELGYNVKRISIYEFENQLKKAEALIGFELNREWYNKSLKEYNFHDWD